MFLCVSALERDLLLYNGKSMVVGTRFFSGEKWIKIVDDVVVVSTKYYYNSKCFDILLRDVKWGL